MKAIITIPHYASNDLKEYVTSMLGDIQEKEYCTVFTTHFGSVSSLHRFVYETKPLDYSLKLIIESDEDETKQKVLKLDFFKF